MKKSLINYQKIKKGMIKLKRNSTLLSIIINKVLKSYKGFKKIKLRLFKLMKSKLRFYKKNKNKRKF
jgi:hypothetical protein